MKIVTISQNIYVARIGDVNDFKFPLSLSWEMEGLRVHACPEGSCVKISNRNELITIQQGNLLKWTELLGGEVDRYIQVVCGAYRSELIKCSIKESIDDIFAFLRVLEPELFIMVLELLYIEEPRLDFVERVIAAIKENEKDAQLRPLINQLPLWKQRLSFMIARAMINNTDDELLSRRAIDAKIIYM